MLLIIFAFKVVLIIRRLARLLCVRLALHKIMYKYAMLGLLASMKVKDECDST